ncbi:unnamed protein product, partial [Ectocarpus sp. 8 AP-2014]
RIPQVAKPFLRALQVRTRQSVTTPSAAKPPPFSPQPISFVCGELKKIAMACSSPARHSLFYRNSGTAICVIWVEMMTRGPDVGTPRVQGPGRRKTNMSGRQPMICFRQLHQLTRPSRSAIFAPPARCTYRSNAKTGGLRLLPAAATRVLKQPQPSYNYNNTQGSLSVSAFA